MKTAVWLIFGLRLSAPCLAVGQASVPQAEPASDQRVLILEEEGGDRYWQREKSVNPKAEFPRYPIGLARAGVTGCVNVGYLIESDGTISGFRVLKSFASNRSGSQAPTAIPVFAQAAIALIQHWKYTPGPDNPQRTRGFTSLNVDYAMGTGSIARCKIPNLEGFLGSKVGG